MICGLCKGNMEKKDIAHTADLGNCVVVVRHVPAMVCTRCGNAWYSGTVAVQLESIVDMISSTAITEVAVVNYSDQVA